MISASSWTGFANRVNCIASSILKSQGDDINFFWQPNGHLPFEYKWIFKNIPNLNIKESSPPKDCYNRFWLEANDDIDEQKIKNIYLYLISKLKYSKKQPKKKYDLGIHFRILNGWANITFDEIIEYCNKYVEKYKPDSIFVVSDKLFEGIFNKLNFKFDLKEAPDMNFDTDRDNFLHFIKFLNDWVDLSHCKTIITQNASSTVFDCAMALGSTVLYSPNEKVTRGDCWFFKNKKMKPWINL